MSTSKGVNPMKKDTFYLCEFKKGNKSVIARKVSGYSEGVIGLRNDNPTDDKSLDSWIATHIPTGTKLKRTEETYKTKRQALNAALNIMATMPDFNTTVDEFFESEYGKQFVESRYEQEKTKIF